MEKEFRSYNVKKVETPTTIEVWEYINEAVFYSVKLDIEEKSKNEKILNEIDTNIYDISDNESNANKQYDALKRKQKYYNEMRWVVDRIVDCNFDDNTKFLTLTFKENIQDITYTNYEFNKFVKRLNFYLYHEKKQKLKYLAVWENQKRGAIHYHVIFFDFPFIEAKELERIWGFGFIKINKIDVDSKENRGRYVSKYFSKDLDVKNYKQKAFFKSRNLIMPKTTKTTNREPIDFSNDNVVYTKIYSRKVPKYYDVFSDTESGVRCSDGFVRYTKIKKG